MIRDRWMSWTHTQQGRFCSKATSEGYGKDVIKE